MVTTPKVHIDNIRSSQPGRTPYNVNHKSAFSSILPDGSVIAWGNSSEGGDISSVSQYLKSGVVQIYPSAYGFAALKEDGSVINWGTSGPVMPVSKDAINIFSSAYSFAALKKDGSVTTWGWPEMGGDSRAVADKLKSGVIEIVSTSSAFAARKDDGSVVVWGSALEGGAPDVATQEKLKSGVKKVYQSGAAFVALKEDGSLVPWGSGYGGDDAPEAVKQLKNVKQVYSTGSAFAALNHDGSVVTWGNPQSGGDSSTVSNLLASDVTDIFAGSDTFIALRHGASENAIVTWGMNTQGSERIAKLGVGNLYSPNPKVYTNDSAFGVLGYDSDGYFTFPDLKVWGNPSTGGDPDRIHHYRMRSGVKVWGGDANALAMGGFFHNPSNATEQGGLYVYGGDNDEMQAVPWPFKVSHNYYVPDQVSNTYFAYSGLSANTGVISWGQGPSASAPSEASKAITLTDARRNARVDFNSQVNHVNYSGKDSLDGSSGADHITIAQSSHQQSYLLGDAGKHLLINLKEGDDYLESFERRVDIKAGSGHDQVISGSQSDKIDGGSGNDILNAGDGNNYVSGGSGNDMITSYNGNDSIESGSGDDLIDSGNGFDRIKLGNGNDQVILRKGDGYAEITNFTSGQDSLYLSAMPMTDVQINQVSGKSQFHVYWKNDLLAKVSGPEALQVSELFHNTLV